MKNKSIKLAFKKGQLTDLQATGFTEMKLYEIICNAIPTPGSTFGGKVKKEELAEGKQKKKRRRRKAHLKIFSLMLIKVEDKNRFRENCFYFTESFKFEKGMRLQFSPSSLRFPPPPPLPSPSLSISLLPHFLYPFSSHFFLFFFLCDVRNTMNQNRKSLRLFYSFKLNSSLT